MFFIIQLMETHVRLAFINAEANAKYFAIIQVNINIK